MPMPAGTRMATPHISTRLALWDTEDAGPALVRAMAPSARRARPNFCPRSYLLQRQRLLLRSLSSHLEC